MNPALVLLFCGLSALSVHAVPYNKEEILRELSIPADVDNDYELYKSTQLDEHGKSIITLQFRPKEKQDQADQSYNWASTNSNAQASSDNNEEYGGQLTDENGNAYWKLASNSKANAESDSNAYSFNSRNEGQGSLSEQANWANSNSDEESSSNNEYVGSTINKNNNAYYKSSSSAKAASASANNAFSYNSGSKNGNQPLASVPVPKLKVQPPKSKKISPFSQPKRYPQYYPPTPYIPHSVYPAPVIPYSQPAYVPQSGNYPGYPLYPPDDDNYAYESPNEYSGGPYPIPAYPPHPRGISNKKPRHPIAPIASQHGIGAGAHADHQGRPFPSKHRPPVGPRRGSPKRPQHPGSNGLQYGPPSPSIFPLLPVPSKQPVFGNPQQQSGKPQQQSGKPQQQTGIPQQQPGEPQQKPGKPPVSGSPQQSDNPQQPQQASPPSSPKSPDSSSSSQANVESHFYDYTDGKGQSYLINSIQSEARSNSSSGPRPSVGSLPQPDNSPSLGSPQQQPPGEPPVSGSPQQSDNPQQPQQASPPSSPKSPDSSSSSQANVDSHFYDYTDGKGQSYLINSIQSEARSNSSSGPRPSVGSLPRPDNSPSLGSPQQQPPGEPPVSGSPQQSDNPQQPQQASPPSSPKSPDSSSSSQANVDSHFYDYTDGKGQSYLINSIQSEARSNSSSGPRPSVGSLPQPDNSPSLGSPQQQPPGEPPVSGSPQQSDNPQQPQQASPPSSPKSPDSSSSSQANVDSHFYDYTDGKGQSYLINSIQSEARSNSSSGPRPSVGSLPQPDNSPSLGSPQQQPPGEPPVSGSPQQSDNPQQPQQASPPSSPKSPDSSSSSQANVDSHFYDYTDGKGQSYLINSIQSEARSNSSSGPRPSVGSLPQPDNSPSLGSPQQQPPGEPPVSGSPQQSDNPQQPQQASPPSSPKSPDSSSSSQANVDSHFYDYTDGKGQSYLINSIQSEARSNSSSGPRPSVGSLPQPDNSPSLGSPQQQPPGEPPVSGSPQQSDNPQQPQQASPPSSPKSPDSSSSSQANVDSHFYDYTDGKGQSYLINSIQSEARSNSSSGPRPSVGSLSQPDNSPSSSTPQQQPGIPQQQPGEPHQQPGKPPLSGSPQQPKKPCRVGAQKPGIGSGLIPRPGIYPKFPLKTRTCVCFNSYSDMPAVLRNQFQFY